MSTGAAENDALMREAVSADAEFGEEARAAAAEAAEVPPSQPGAPLVIAADDAQQIGGILKVLAGIGAPMFPSIGRIYTPDTIETIAQSLAHVFVKRGWSAGSAFGKYAEEFAAAAVILPIALATYQGITRDIAAAKAKPVHSEGGGDAGQA